MPFEKIHHSPAVVCDCVVVLCAQAENINGCLIYEYESDVVETVVHDWFNETFIQAIVLWIILLVISYVSLYVNYTKEFSSSHKNIQTYDRNNANKKVFV